jgi:predicted GNAT superfamily acetyltransferase
MIVIRACSGWDELEACVQLQIETWGYDVGDVIPRKAFLVAQKIGGQVVGAFDTALSGVSKEGDPESLVGFAMSWPGVKTDKDAPLPYLHSHMLAVRKNYRNRGLGARLKLEQRRDALERGIRLMEWTFNQERLSQHSQAGSYCFQV